ncbi:hypothetical protein HanOQP8_Chr12g0442961 [Helianthus annuus]|nr:hypothetical protein HanOQP8_Chr12g0442961 [Helianthus annuus]
MDTGFHHQQSTGMNQQAITFQASPRNEQSEMIMIGDLHRVKRTGSMSFSGSSGGSSSYTGIGNSCESHVVESVPVVSVPVVPETKHRAGLDGDWSVAEQHKLEQALVNEWLTSHPWAFCAMWQPRTLWGVF